MRRPNEKKFLGWGLLGVLLSVIEWVNYCGVKEIRGGYYVSCSGSPTVSQLTKKSGLKIAHSGVYEKLRNKKMSDQPDIELFLVHLNRIVGLDGVLFVLSALGFESSNWAHLILFGSMFPDVQKEFPVFALGTCLSYFWAGQEYLYLFVDKDVRIFGATDKMGNEHYTTEFRKFTRFLVVRTAKRPASEVTQWG